MLFVNFFKFYLNKAAYAGDEIYYKCSVNLCSVKAIIKNDNEVFVKGLHNHSSNLNELLKLQLKSFIHIKLTKKPFLIPTKTYNDSIFGLLEKYRYIDEYISKFPSFSSLKSYMYRLKHIYYPSSSFIAPDNFKPEFFVLSSGINNLLYYNLNNEKCVIQ